MFEIINETKEELKEIEDIKNVLTKAIEIEEAEDGFFNVILVDNEYIHELNYKDMPNGDVRVLGDIYISVEKARSQAIEYGHSFKREICFLAVHGFLHLLGYDHMIKAEEEIMFGRQELILNEAGTKK